MTENTYLKVLEIFRSKKIPSTFFILTKKDLYKVNQNLYAKILQGYVYKYDIIYITDNNKENGIKFETVENGTESDTSEFKYDYLDYIYHKYTLLPFITDTLPYYDKEVDFLPESIKPVISGKIIYKTRINVTNTSQYLFFILETDNELFKIIIWKENLKYSSLNVGDFIGITKFRAGKGYPPQGHIEHNEFSEMGFFNVKELTVHELFKLPGLNTKETFKNIEHFKNISGFIKYRSVLNRKSNHGYSEYYLLMVEDVKVVLFYNSDLNFYNIEAGNRIEITNLRQITRQNATFYISTIFTQFKYEDINEFNELCSTFLHETPYKRKHEDIFEDDTQQKRSKNSCMNDKNTDLEINTSLINLSNEDVMHLIDDNTVTVNLEVVTPDTKMSPDIIENIKSQKQNNTILSENTFIESAFGFLPDSFDDFEESFDIINSQKFTLTHFFCPKQIKLEELETYCNRLVINESDKFLISAKIKDINDHKEFSDYYISYVNTNCIENQYPITINIENYKDFFLFENFFAKECDDVYKNISTCIGRECDIILHVFRASIDLVIYNVSNIRFKKL